MQTLWHAIMSYVWGILAVVGIIFAAILWVGMAVWDGARGVFQRLTGDVDRRKDGGPAGS